MLRMGRVTSEQSWRAAIRTSGTLWIRTSISGPWTDRQDATKLIGDVDLLLWWMDQGNDLRRKHVRSLLLTCCTWRSICGTQSCYYTPVCLIFLVPEIYVNVRFVRGGTRVLPLQRWCHCCSGTETDSDKCWCCVRETRSYECWIWWRAVHTLHQSVRHFVCCTNSDGSFESRSCNEEVPVRYALFVALVRMVVLTFLAIDEIVSSHGLRLPSSRFWPALS